MKESVLSLKVKTTQHQFS